MKNVLFIGGSSEIAIKLKKSLKKYNFYNLSRKKMPIYQKKNIVIKNYNKNELIRKINNINVKFNSIFIFNGIHVPSTLSFFDENIFKETLAINLILPLKITKYLINSDLLIDNCSITFVGSVAGIYPEIGNAYYSVSKSALIFSSKVLSKELKKNKIRVNSLSLGMIKNKMSKKILKNLPNTKNKSIFLNSKNNFINSKKMVKKFQFLIENKSLNGKNVILSK